MVPYRNSELSLFDTPGLINAEVWVNSGSRIFFCFYFKLVSSLRGFVRTPYIQTSSLWLT